MTRDEQINAMLNYFSNTSEYSSFREGFNDTFVSQNVGKSDNDIQLLFKEMKERDLIFLYNGSHLDCRITPTGVRMIEEYGGWIAYNKAIAEAAKRLSSKETWRHRLNFILGFATLLLAGYGVYLTDKTNKLEQKLEDITKQRDSLLIKLKAHVHLLETKAKSDSIKK